MTPGRGRPARLVEGLLKFVALVAVAGGVGAALGAALSNISQEDQPVTSDDGRTATAAAVATTTAPGTATSTATVATTATAPAGAMTATTPPAAASSALAQIRVRVLGARLHTDATPSGRQEQRARVSVRVRAENTGGKRVALAPPTLGVGRVRVPADVGAAAADATFDPLRPKARQTVTLRFSLAGKATPKVVRDRRARLLIGGQSVPMRVKVQSPAQ